MSHCHGMPNYWLSFGGSVISDIDNVIPEPRVVQQLYIENQNYESITIKLKSVPADNIMTQ